MCEFCHRHGEGKRWYLQVKNYSQDLLSDVRRRRFIIEFVSRARDDSDTWDQLDALAAAPPVVRRMVGGAVSRRMKRTHFGQVAPLEDIREIFRFVDSIVRLPCVCRQSRGCPDARYCYGVCMGPNGGAFRELLDGVESTYYNRPDTSGLEELTVEQALEAFAEHEQQGLCHTVWTFVTPFIGGICNCDRVDCMAMKSTLRSGVKTMFRGECVAEADWDRCAGCRACMRVCQFGALSYSAAHEKAFVDPRVCYGCGVCRSVCPTEAIKLRPRSEVAVAADLW